MSLYLERNPLTEADNKFRLETVAREFPETDAIKGNGVLSFWKYSSGIPERFFLRRTFTQVLSFLQSSVANRPDLLKQFLTKYHRLLNIGMRTLDETNELDFHETELPSDNSDFALLMDSKVLPAYLKLVEGAFANLILLPALAARTKGGLEIKGFDVFHRVKVLDGTDLGYLCDNYSNTIRNSIAHGTSEFHNDGILFVDRKSSDRRTYRHMMDTFDRLLDICNGIAFALKLLILSHREILEGAGAPLPLHPFLEELKAHAQSPGWTLNACLEQENLNGVSQLNLFVTSRLIDRRRIEWTALRTAILAENFLPGYDRYFFRLKCRRTKFGDVGWAGYDGARLRDRRLNPEESSWEDFAGVVESGGVICFCSRNLHPKLVTLLTYPSIIKSTFRLAFARLAFERNETRLDVRKSTLHRSGSRAVINGSIVLGFSEDTDLLERVRENARRMLRRSVRAGRKKHAFYKIVRFLPTGYVRLHVYTSDRRLRELGVSGLSPDLLCTISKRSRTQIRDIDISGGVPEMVGSIRIVWNRHSEFFSVIDPNEEHSDGNE